MVSSEGPDLNIKQVRGYKDKKLNDMRQGPEAQSTRRLHVREKISWKQVVTRNGPKAGNLTPLHGDSRLRIVDGKR